MATASSTPTSLFLTTSMTGAATLLPTINVTNPTPPRPTILNPSSSPSTSSTTYRLLYRGALSLSDSHLLLDGLTFCASGPVLQNALALALESMRGRPSLRFMGIVSLKEVWLDTSGGVSLDIYPYAMLSQIYFENTFCLNPITSSDGRSEHGVRVALGDTDGPGTTEIIIYAQLSSSSNAVTLQVARITPTPPPRTNLRIPRPDDPTPRQPPKALASRSGKGKGKEMEVDDRVRAAREIMLFGRAARPLVGGDKGKVKAVFKVPSVPRKKGKKDEDIAGDVFISEVSQGPESALESANKAVIKKTTVRMLATIGIGRAHLEFKDIFGFVYRGTAFALRAQMKRARLDPKSVDVEHLIHAHIQLYTLPPCSASGTDVDPFA